MWVLFTAPCPTPDGQSARDLYESGCWQIESEPGEVAIVLDGDVGLVPLGGDA